MEERLTYATIGPGLSAEPRKYAHCTISRRIRKSLRSSIGFCKKFLSYLYTYAAQPFGLKFKTQTEKLNPSHSLGLIQVEF